MNKENRITADQIKEEAYVRNAFQAGVIVKVLPKTVKIAFDGEQTVKTVYKSTLLKQFWNVEDERRANAQQPDRSTARFSEEPNIDFSAKQKKGKKNGACGAVSIVDEQGNTVIVDVLVYRSKKNKIPKSARSIRLTRRPTCVDLLDNKSVNVGYIYTDGSLVTFIKKHGTCSSDNAYCGSFHKSANSAILSAVEDYVSLSNRSTTKGEVK